MQSIWWAAFGYFAAYVPYSFLTKELTTTHGGGLQLTGVQLLAGSTLASVATALAFLGITGWWREAPRFQVGSLRVPYPTLWPALSGLCSTAIIATTTLSYTFDGASIVLMMLLMRGGVLVIAPVVDFASRRGVQPRSWIALGLTLGGVAVATVGRIDLVLTLAALLDIAVYLAAYFVRLRLMSHAGKRVDAAANRRFFVEEQLVSSPALVLLLLSLAWLGDGALSQQLRSGYAQAFSAPNAWLILAVGVASQGTGVFGALVLLDPREHSFCVPVNRGSSILAGVTATALLAMFAGGAALSVRELFGASLVMLAMGMLALPPGVFRTAPRMSPGG
ncbi:MAG: hypothetical protein M3Y59_00760 [Myxococcota bacterium]|nr:hypothetical protein [Myxococcota bacterium]